MGVNLCVCACSSIKMHISLVPFFNRFAQNIIQAISLDDDDDNERVQGQCTNAESPVN